MIRPLFFSSVFGFRLRVIVAPLKPTYWLLDSILMFEVSRGASYKLASDVCFVTSTSESRESVTVTPLSRRYENGF